MNLQPSLIHLVYNSFDIFFRAVNTYAVTERFTFGIKPSKKSNKEILRKVWFQYDKNRTYKAKKHSVRKMSTIKDEYSSEIIVISHSEQNTWAVEIKYGNHNHLLTLTRANLTYWKIAITDNIKLKIVTQTQINTSAQQIFLFIHLRTDKENLFYKANEIYTQYYYHRWKKLCPFSSVQALIYKLNKKKRWHIKYCFDLDFCITCLFFAKTSLYKVLKLNYKVFLIDCTYKINFSQMLLRIIKRIPPMNRKYYNKFAFLTNGRVEDYWWIL